MVALQPPRADSAEQAVFGAILIEPGSIDLVAAILDASDFYTSWRAYVFGVMLDLHRAGRQVDTVTLGHRLGELGRWSDDLDGKLRNDVAAVPSAAGLVDYARAVRAAAVRRRALVLTHELQAGLSGGTDEDLAAICGSLVTCPRFQYQCLC